MFFNQELKAGRAIGLACSALVLAACSMWHSREPVESAEPPVAATSEGATAAAPAQPEPTAVDLAIQAAPASTTTVTEAPAPTADAINPNAPKRYTVKQGDTLWGIASMFLRDPWLWPEIWYVNPQVQNPHLIYPGDVLALAYGADGRPQIRLEQGGPARLEPHLHSSPLEGAIPTIPYAAIASFLSRSTVLSSSQAHHSPYVLAFRADHKVGGNGHEVYVRGLSSAAQGARFLIFHIKDELHDPDNHHFLGYEGIYTATAVIEQPGDPAKALLLDSAQETLSGDVLIPDNAAAPLNFMPRPPHGNVHGRIMAAVDRVNVFGRYDIVAINRGTADGVDVGTVLAVDQVGDVVPDRGAAGYDSSRKINVFGHGVHLPEERAGTVLVFKSYDRVSYALVVSASAEMRVADVVRSP